MEKEMRVYVIDVDSFEDSLGSDDYTDEEFMSFAEEQGTVFTLRGFHEEFNYTDNINQDKYIRFIERVMK